MNKDLTDVTVVMDRSGSMQSIRSDAEGGLNRFVDDQKMQPGKCRFTLVQFDTTYEFVHRGVDVQEVHDLKLVPRGGTALLDAVGRAIVETGERLGKLPEADRPGLVVFVILTDGQENSSREYTLDQVRKMVTHQQDAYNWQFTYLGANQDAFAEAGAMGVPTAGIAAFAGQNVGAAYGSAAQNVVRMRSTTAKGQKVDSGYTDGERRLMSDPKKP